ncbi:MAG: hypothetical protein K0Q72_3279 [Armatimonadetes bacterium]|jgi:hypothetical protein|nr:hypothetical protein [Armatimonadota bacterium]
MVSDAYLARLQSRGGSSEEAVLAPKGATITEALDALCRRYCYLWWEQDGCVYLRARAWPWDAELEPPDRLLDSWSVALDRKGRLGAAEVALLAGLTGRQLQGLANLAGRPTVQPVRQERLAALREFAAFFAAAAPGPRLRLLGTGLAVRPEPSATELLKPFTDRAQEGPVLLRLGQTIGAALPGSPEAWTVGLSVVRQWPGESSALEFTFGVPRLPAVATVGR